MTYTHYTHIFIIPKSWNHFCGPMTYILAGSSDEFTENIRLDVLRWGRVKEIQIQQLP